MKDTLLFMLPIGKITYTALELVEEIAIQKDNFTKRFNYEPKYINIPDDINDFLFENLTIKNGIVDIEKNYKYDPTTILGMEIISRFKEPEYIKDNEAICMEVK